MNVRQLTTLATIFTLAACSNSNPQTDGPDATGQLVTTPEVPLECTPSERMPLQGRASPYDSTRITVAGSDMLVCYGRPAARDREIFPGLVPYGQLWRTGANEPTIVHVPFVAEIAGVRVQPGSYSLYTVPNEGEWQIVVNRSISQWGHESSYTPEVEAQEVGRGSAPTERLDQHVESFTIRGEPTPAGADLLMEWERTRVRVPIRAVTG